MMRRGILALALVPALLAAPSGAGEAAPKTVVKLATLAPDGTIWHRALEQMGQEWSESTDGRVGLRLYPGAVAGDDADMVRKMRIGQIQAASLSVIGLTEIDDAFNVFAIPMFFRSEEELRHVLREVEPTLRRRLEAKGFVFLNWGDGGWIHFFTKRPVRTVDDLKGVKMFTAAGNERWVRWWRSNGFQPVALSTSDIMTGLQTGMIDAYPTTPLAALSLQWYRQTPYMLDLGLAPLIGATVMPTRAWERFGAKDREAMLAAARRVEETLFERVPGSDRDAVEEMKKRGLTVVSVRDPARLATWRNAAEDLAASMRGSIVDEEVYDRVKRARDAYRRSTEAGGDP